MKSGFVVLIGRSNVGKSTLLNNLVGTKLAIVTPKPQTTRMPIRGVVNDPRGQIVFVDTPGIFAQKFNRLTARLNEIARESLQDVDVILYVVDPTRAIGNEERLVMRLIEPLKTPKILVINKIDARDQPFLEEYEELEKNFSKVVKISALGNKNLNSLIDSVLEFLPEGKPFYPDMQLTDLETRVWMEEVIREKVFLAMREEIPYTVAVRVEEVEERERKKRGKKLTQRSRAQTKHGEAQKIVYIRASILTTSDRYKKMLIGAGGRQIKELGQAARKELEAAMNRPIFLDLEVVLEPHWQQAL